jgi:hypothetical protein
MFDTAHASVANLTLIIGTVSCGPTTKAQNFVFRKKLPVTGEAL